MTQSQIDHVYIEKRKLVEKMADAFTMVPGITALEYKHVRDKYSEIVRFTFEDGSKTYINVTGDSLWAIAGEIATVFLDLRSDAEITNEAHCVVIEGWFEDED